MNPFLLLNQAGQCLPGVRWLFTPALTLLLFLALSTAASANPYLAKPGERPMTLRIATCAVSGGFVHLYTAIDNGLFSKYGLNFEHIYIQASAPSLAALAADEIQFLYCAADATLPTLVSGIGGKIVAAPLVKLPYVMVARKEIKGPEDLRGKTIGVARAGNISERLSRAVVRKFNIPQNEVTVRPVGGSQSERFQAMRMNLVQAIVVTPPLDMSGHGTKDSTFFIVWWISACLSSIAPCTPVRKCCGRDRISFNASLPLLPRRFISSRKTRTKPRLPLPKL